MFHKSRIYPIILIIVLFAVWKYRESGRLRVVSLSGTTMGTTYSIKYLSKDGTGYQQEVDSLLLVFNQSLSTYIPNSEISQFNRDTVFYFKLPFFLPVLEESKRVYVATDGAFDPTVMPLVRAWGFGSDQSQIPDSTIIDSLLQFVGFDKISFDSKMVTKSKPGVELDFSAVAKGYGVDVIGTWLADQGINNYFIEIGGEVKCKGVNNKGQPWRIGIEDPTHEINNRAAKAIVELQNRAMATSGNYRNYYVVDSLWYSHTIDPATGFPIRHALLSATVFADDCITADAYATAFMVAGVEKARQMIEENPGIGGFLIYRDKTGKLRTFTSREAGDIQILNDSGSK